MAKVSVWLVAASLSLAAATQAFGAVITFDFDDASNGAKSYSKYGFTFAPTNFNSGHCYQPVAGGGNGSCFHEVKNGDPTFLTEDDGTNFDLLSFFFNLEGQGGGGNPGINEFSIIADDDPLTAFSFNFTTDYSSLAGVDIFEYDSSTQSVTGGVTFLTQQTEYFVIFNDLFDDVTKITFDPSATARVRIDCVAVSATPNGMNQTTDGLTACSPPPIPLPATGWLILVGIGGLAALRRRR